MATWKKIFIIISAIVIVLIGGGLYFLNQFLNALAPPKIEITKEYISTDRDFVNGVTIEKILVDSLGAKGYPVKYTTFYTTSCNIQHPKNRPTDPPSKIEFYKPGKYSWDEDTVKVDHIHNGLSRESVSSSDKLWWLNKYGKLPVCPLKFERNQWYYFTIGDPKVTGIFFFIDKEGREHQYFLASGVSPI
ncbi:hypothetical protein V6B16_14920 [Salinimicrobium catena]|uniref:hypothetical protein n=1 Tax=Salinimicrobium catena TaxID=390640 RepID=UPI002FE4BAD3